MYPCPLLDFVVIFLLAPMKHPVSSFPLSNSLYFYLSLTYDQSVGGGHEGLTWSRLKSLHPLILVDILNLRVQNPLKPDLSKLFIFYKITYLYYSSSVFCLSYLKSP